MSLFTHNYSSIITKGLGNPACCSLIVSQFSLTGLCSIEIITPPTTVGGGGGGGAFLVPFPQQLNQQTRIVLITIKFPEDKVWRRSYVINVFNANKLVTVMNFGNKVKDSIAIGVEHIKQIGRRVIDVFHKEDK